MQIVVKQGFFFGASAYVLARAPGEKRRPQFIFVLAQGALVDAEAVTSIPRTSCVSRWTQASSREAYGPSTQV